MDFKREMKMGKELEQDTIDGTNCVIFSEELKHIKLKQKNNEYIISLVDKSNYEILRGYGKSCTEALNDLHSNLL